MQAIFQAAPVLGSSANGVVARNLSSQGSEFRGLPAVARTSRAAAPAAGRVSPAVTTCIANPPVKPAGLDRPAKPEFSKLSKVEGYKAESNYLRQPLMDELKNDLTYVSEAATQICKFHGTYMQDDREKRQPGQEKAYQFMLRTRQPAGKVSNLLYRTMDDLSDKYGNGTMRLTTRQAFQLHGILKKDIKVVFQNIISAMGSTLSACGDVNRNVMAPSAPYSNRAEYLYAAQLADKIADLFAPQAGAYYDIWLDGAKFMSSVHKESPDVTIARMENINGSNKEGLEPIYGEQYLPRKFKMAVTVPGDNSVDALTNDVAIVVLCNERGQLQGFDVYVGGGMGRTHRNNETFPRLATPLGYVDKDDILYLLKAIVATQRDYGRRDDRKYSRMKYLVESWGIDKFRSVVESYYGKKILPFKELPPWETPLYLGWMEQGDGRYSYGISVENGRIKGEFKKAVRAVLDRYELPVILTANQDMVLCDIFPAWRTDIENTLKAGGMKTIDQIDTITLNSMACPAFPLCGLAIGEAERALPDFNKRIRAVCNEVGLPSDETFVVRMTGCPNGCARPYMAELGFVGDGPNSYQIWLGGTANHTRLAELYLEKVKIDDLEATLRPLLTQFKQQRLNAKETLGDFVTRVGFDALRAFAAAPPAAAPAAAAAAPAVAVPAVASSAAYINRPRVAIDKEVFDKLVAAAEERNTTLAQLTQDAILAYLAKK
eukprot:jgi/Mesvir1/20847/Mv07938-RA.1